MRNRHTIGLVAMVVSSLLWAPGLRAQAPAASTPERPTSVGTAVDAAMIGQYPGLKRALLGAVEKMPDDAFGLKPSDGARTFAETAAHIGISNLGMCSAANGKPIAREVAQARIAEATSKAAVLKLFHDGFAECDAMFATPGTDRTATSRVFMVVHAWEVYGTMAVYLRMKSIVPPTSEGQQKGAGGGGPAAR